MLNVHSVLIGHFFPHHILSFTWKLALDAVEFIFAEGMVLLELKMKLSINHVLSVCLIQHSAVIESILFPGEVCQVFL